MEFDFFHMKSFVIFHALLVSASILIGLGDFIPPLKRKIGGKRNICEGLVFRKVPHCLR